MDNQQSQPAYYSVMPANVRYDSSLSPNAKLLYSEITALCNKEGYCWATNKYFAELYNVDTRTVRRWINQLVDRGYIFTKMIYKEEKKEIAMRQIFIQQIPFSTDSSSIAESKNDTSTNDFYTPEDKNVRTPPGDKNVRTPGDKNVRTPGDKNVLYNNTSINNTSNNNSSHNSNVVETVENNSKSPSSGDELRKQIHEYCSSNNLLVDPDEFFDYYQVRGWKINGEKINSWSSLIRTWNRRAMEKQNTNSGSFSIYNAPYKRTDNTAWPIFDKELGLYVKAIYDENGNIVPELDPNTGEKIISK